MPLDKLATKAIFTRIKPTKCKLKAINIEILFKTLENEQYLISAVFENTNGTLNFWSYIKEDLDDFSDFIYTKTQNNELSSFDRDLLHSLYLEKYNTNIDLGKGFARQTILYHTRGNAYDEEADF